MQAPFSCLPHVLAQIEASISPARLARYLPAASGDKHLALRLYVWNARLCEEFYLPLQTAEVCVRNAIADTLKRRYGRGWYSAAAVQALLLDRYRDELNALVLSEQMNRGAHFTGDHVISGLSFGFWVSLMTSRYAKHIWQMGVSRSFPKAPATLSLADAHTAVDQLRQFRNKVMHHYDIFDRSPAAEYRNLETVMEWISPDTMWLLRQLCSPPRVINARPKSL